MFEVVGYVGDWVFEVVGCVGGWLCRWWRVWACYYCRKNIIEIMPIESHDLNQSNNRL